MLGVLDLACLPALAQVEGADRWVQCDRCEIWRIVPAQHWQAVQDDPREEWRWWVHMGWALVGARLPAMGGGLGRGSAGADTVQSRCRTSDCPSHPRLAACCPAVTQRVCGVGCHD